MLTHFGFSLYISRHVSFFCHAIHYSLQAYTDGKRKLAILNVEHILKEGLTLLTKLKIPLQQAFTLSHCILSEDQSSAYNCAKFLKSFTNRCNRHCPETWPNTNFLFRNSHYDQSTIIWNQSAIKLLVNNSMDILHYNLATILPSSSSIELHVWYL